MLENMLPQKIKAKSFQPTCCLLPSVLHDTGEPLYCGHHWDQQKCPDFRGILNSKVVICTELPQLGQKQVSIFEGCPQ